MVEPQPSKLVMRVRFPSSALAQDARSDTHLQSLPSTWPCLWLGRRAINVPLESAEAGAERCRAERTGTPTVSRRDETLIGEIERDLLDGKALADLRKCIVLGGRSGSVELRDWASRQLRGYGPDDELPDGLRSNSR
jgi:hypothetical protein